jgi:type I restriction enzyme, R subunit
VDASVSWLSGARDIANVYEVECPTFFASNVLNAATEGREFHYGAIGQAPEHWLMWGSTEDPYDMDGLPRVQRSVDLLLTPARVLSVLRDFTLFEQRPGGGVRKLIPRYPQVEAAAAVHQKILAGGQRGLIWHYQGTGKTLLMAFLATMLLNDERVGGPTVLIVLDRLDLIEQVERQFRTAGLPRLSVASSKAELRQLLRDDRRGVVLTTIFRFQEAGELNKRDNIVVLVDEAHRTQEGTMGEDMRAALPNARFFGLTGTPISDKDRNTFTVFGDPADPGHVLNAYSIERSIADGASVPVHVETRLVKFHLDRVALDQAFDEMATEENLSEEEREFLVGRAGHVKTVLMNPDRVRAVCQDIVDHYTAKIAPLGLKAQVVAYDRELVVAYETEINRILAERNLPHTTAVVMTSGGKSDPPAWSKYDLDRAGEQAVIARFNDPTDSLSLLIVTAKLLTGFDAPIEQAMYLDKPLRRHTLFQAITRTNRRYTNPATGQEKRYGLIVDYIGLGEQIGKALKPADPNANGQRTLDIDGLATEFEAKMAAALTPRFKGLERTDFSFPALAAARQRIATNEAKEAFAREFIALEALWEFLDPHETLTKHRGDYKWLAQLYEAVKPTNVSYDLIWARLGAKTLSLVHGHMSNVAVAGTGLEEIVVDPGAIDIIRQLVAQDALPGITVDPEHPLTVEEVFKSIEARIKRRLGKSDHPVYRTLAEQIERLRQQAITRVEDSIEFLKKALEAAKSLVEAEKLEAEGRLDEAVALLDPNIGALTQIVDEFKPDGTPVIVDDVVRDIDAIVKQVRFTGWNETQEGDRTVRKEIRVVLKRYQLPLTGPLFDNAYAYVRENY